MAAVLRGVGRYSGQTNKSMAIFLIEENNAALSLIRPEYRTKVAEYRNTWVANPCHSVSRRFCLH